MQQRKSIFTCVTSLINRCADLAPGQELHSETRIDSISIDSLACFEIVYEIEERQGIELDEVSLSELQTIGDLVGAVVQELTRSPVASTSTTSSTS